MNEHFSSSDPNTALRGTSSGDADSANRLMQVVYQELRELAGAYLRNSSKRGSSHTLQPTALVHEAYLRLIDQSNPEWKDQAHFKAVAARAMKQILIDHAERKNAQKRGADRKRVTLDSAVLEASRPALDVIELKSALERLQLLDARKAQVAEAHIFGGMNSEEIAHVIGVTSRTVERDWRMAKAWLSSELSPAGNGP